MPNDELNEWHALALVGGGEATRSWTPLLIGYLAPVPAFVITIGSIGEILDTNTVEWDVEVTWSRRPRSAPGDHDRHFVTARLAGFYPATTPGGLGYDAPRSGTM